MPILLWLYFSDLKKGQLLHFEFNYLTTKPMPTFWAGDPIKTKLIELRFRCHMPATKP